MKKEEICIAIPIYKVELNAFEIQSVEQCVKILSGYQIYFIAPLGLNTSFYKSHFEKINNYKFFESKYFENLKGYNQLMLNPSFYKTFLIHNYMLVYQTDCYVFNDDLLAWATKGYDYIGGLLFENFHGNPNTGAKLWCAANGGLSLRKINTFYSVLTSKRKLKKKEQLKKEKLKHNYIKGVKRIKLHLLFLLKRLGYKNSPSYYAGTFNKNEDVFFINLAYKYNLISMPKTKEALFFSWDRCPDYLYSRYKKLPFACHAWYRTDVPYENNKLFWKQFIKMES